MTMHMLSSWHQQQKTRTLFNKYCHYHKDISFLPANQQSYFPNCCLCKVPALKPSNKAPTVAGDTSEAADT